MFTRCYTRKRKLAGKCQLTNRLYVTSNEAVSSPRSRFALSYDFSKSHSTREQIGSSRKREREKKSERKESTRERTETHRRNERIERTARRSVPGQLSDLSDCLLIGELSSILAGLSFFFSLSLCLCLSAAIGFPLLAPVLALLLSYTSDAQI